MPSLENYDHRTGIHCGAASLRNVAEFYNIGYNEPECFGLGAGLVFDVLEDESDPWPQVRASAAWLVEAFFDNLDVPHFVGGGDDWQGAWDDVADTIDSDDPAILFLDSDALPYLPDEDHHAFPHVAVCIGYDADEETVTLSDSIVDDRQEIAFDDLRDAWTLEGVVETEYEYVTVTRGTTLVDDGTAAARAINQTVDYFTNALDAPRTTGRPGEEGIPALRTFGAELPDWSDLDDPLAPASAAVRALDWHGDGTAFRELYADALSDLAPRAGTAGGRDDQLRGIAAEWRSILDDLRFAARGEVDPERTYEEIGSRLGDVARREEQLFQELGRQI